MPRSIESFPPEIFERIVQELSLPDIPNLRLASRQISVLTTQETFKRRFVNKNVCVAQADLSALAELASPGGLGCLVESLTLTGVAIDLSLLQSTSKGKVRWVTESNGPMSTSIQHKCTSEELAKVETEITDLKRRRANYMMLKESNIYSDLLTQAFRNIAANGKLRRLRSLTLDVVVLREDAVTERQPINGGDWKLIWAAASDCFDIAMTSLAGSGLLVDELSAFNSTYKCSIGSDKLMSSAIHTSHLAESLKDTIFLSLSLSERVLSDTELRARTADLQASISQQINFEGLGRLIGLCPRLESLHLHWYNTSQYRYREDRNLIIVPESQLFKTFAKTAYLPCLKTLALRGVYVTEQALLAIVRGAPIQNLILENVHMEEGSFQSIFDHCTSSEADMQRLFFDDLWQHRLVYFDGEGKSKYPLSQPFNGGQTLERTGDDVRKPIRYVFPDGYALGSPQAYTERQKRRRDYGPP